MNVLEHWPRWIAKRKTADGRPIPDGTRSLWPDASPLGEHEVGYVRADIHEGSIEALKAENARLRAAYDLAQGRPMKVMRSIELCFTEWGKITPRICCLQIGHDKPCFGYPVNSSTGKLLRKLRNVQGAVSRAKKLEGTLTLWLNCAYPDSRAIVPGPNGKSLAELTRDALGEH